MTMLDERKAAILRAVVEEYIDTAQPVGSAHVAQADGVDVSSATVRNEMAILETEGFLRQPHTSAGRVPTEKGYRFFVDNISVSTPHGVLEPAKKAQVQTFFARAHGQLEEMLHDTSCLLSSLTHYAAMVVPPQHEDATVRSVQIVGLGSRVALVVAVLSFPGSLLFVRLLERDA
jgi:heat-inducible transcriptional repressor